MIRQNVRVETFQIRTGEVQCGPTVNRGWAVSELGSGLEAGRFLDPQIELNYQSPAGRLNLNHARFYVSGIDSPEIQHQRLPWRELGTPLLYVDEFAVSLSALARLRIGLNDRIKITKAVAREDENWAAISVNEHGPAAHREGGPIGLDFEDNDSFIVQRFAADRALVAVGVVMVPTDGVLIVQHSPEEGIPREVYRYIYRPNSSDGLEVAEDRPWGRPSSGGEDSYDREPIDRRPSGTEGGAVAEPERYEFETLSARETE